MTLLGKDGGSRRARLVRQPPFTRTDTGPHSVDVLALQMMRPKHGAQQAAEQQAPRVLFLMLHYPEDPGCGQHQRPPGPSEVGRENGRPSTMLPACPFSALPSPGPSPLFPALPETLCLHRCVPCLWCASILALEAGGLLCMLESSSDGLWWTKRLNLEVLVKLKAFSRDNLSTTKYFTCCLIKAFCK